MGSDHFKCGYVALAGLPNVGKSTLLNRLIGQHLSIISPKPQTTRERVPVLLSTDAYQIIFVDAPGLIEPTYALQESMRWAAERAIEEADVVVFVLDVSETLPTASLLSSLSDRSKPFILALNKIDSAGKSSISRTISACHDCGYEYIPLSASRGDGIDELLDQLVDHLPTSPPLYPLDEVSNLNVRFFVEEYVREACLEVFHDEVPHSIACRIDEFRESGNPIYIRAHVYVERDSQKGIVIGEGGQAIKRVGQRARRRIEELLERPVYLELRVKVMARWSRKPDRLVHLGYRLPPSRHNPLPER